MENNKCKIGLISSILFFVLFHFIYWIRFDNNWWHDKTLIYLVPIWIIGIFYVGYALSDKFFKRKDMFFPKNKPENYNIEKSKSKWEEEKLFMFYRLAQIGKSIFGAAIPFVVFLHLNNNFLSISNIAKIAILVLLTVICWIIEYKLKIRLNNNRL